MSSSWHPSHIMVLYVTALDNAIVDCQLSYHVFCLKQDKRTGVISRLISSCCIPCMLSFHILSPVILYHIMSSWRVFSFHVMLYHLFYNRSLCIWPAINTHCHVIIFWPWSYHIIVSYHYHIISCYIMVIACHHIPIDRSLVCMLAVRQWQVNWSHHNNHQPSPSSLPRWV